jgi:O-antigen/teichoic acid export membrane protein
MVGITILGTLVNVLCNLALIPKLGIIGGGLSMVVSYVVLNSVMVGLGQRFYKVEYEWRILGMMYLNLFVASFFLLIMQGGAPATLFVFVSKLLFLAAFIYIGFYSNILRKEKWERLMRMAKGERHVIIDAESV